MFDESGTLWFAKNPEIVQQIEENLTGKTVYVMDGPYHCGATGETILPVNVKSMIRGEFDSSPGDYIDALIEELVSHLNGQGGERVYLYQLRTDLVGPMVSDPQSTGHRMFYVRYDVA